MRTEKSQKKTKNNLEFIQNEVRDMAAEIITKEDLQQFRLLLIKDLQEIIYQLKKENNVRISEGV